MKGERVKHGVLRKWNEAKGAWEDVKEDVHQKGHGLKEGIYQRWNDFKGVWEDVKDTGETILEDTKFHAKEAYDDAKFHAKHWRHEHEPKWEEGKEAVRETVRDAKLTAEEEESKIKNAFYTATGKAWEIASNLKHKLEGTAHKTKQAAEENAEYPLLVYFFFIFHQFTFL